MLSGSTGVRCITVILGDDVTILVHVLRAVSKVYVHFMVGKSRKKNAPATSVSKTTILSQDILARSIGRAQAARIYSPSQRSANLNEDTFLVVPD